MPPPSPIVDGLIVVLLFITSVDNLIRQTPCSQSSIDGHSMLFVHDPIEYMFSPNVLSLAQLYEPVRPLFAPSSHFSSTQIISIPHSLCWLHFVPDASESYPPFKFPIFMFAHLVPDNPRKRQRPICIEAANIGHRFDIAGADNCSSTGNRKGGHNRGRWDWGQWDKLRLSGNGELTVRWFWRR